VYAAVGESGCYYQQPIKNWGDVVLDQIIGKVQLVLRFPSNPLRAAPLMQKSQTILQVQSTGSVTTLEFFKDNEKDAHDQSGAESIA
jgi:hypothetical protein